MVDTITAWGKEESIFGRPEPGGIGGLGANHLADSTIHMLNLPRDFGKTLRGFEKILGRKFKCYDCQNIKNYSPYSNCCKYFSFNRFNLHGLKPCKHLKLSKDIIKIIKLRNKKIEDTKINTYPRISLPNPFFHNNRICPYCNEKVGKGCRIQIEKKYQWFHSKCRNNHGFKNPIGFYDDFELIL